MSSCNLPALRTEEQASFSITNSPQNFPFSVNKMIVLAKAAALSGFYKDAKDQNKSLVKMMIGHELGIGPGASLSGIYVVQDKIVLSANLIASLIKKSGRYDYKVVTHTDTECVIDFFSVDPQTRKQTLIGKSAFTMKDAEKAGLLNKPGPWKAYPRNMLFARALTNGQRWHCADVTAGTPIYTPDEIGLEETEEGELAVATVAPTSKALVDELLNLAKETESPLEKLLAHYGADSVQTLGDNSATAAIAILKQRLAVRRQVAQQATTTVSEQHDIQEPAEVEVTKKETE